MCYDEYYIDGWPQRDSKDLNDHKVSGNLGESRNMKEDRDPFEIDLYNLDRELRDVARMTRQVGRQEADARHVYAQSKARLNIIRARLRFAIRRDPAKFGFITVKPSVDDVDAAIEMEKDYQEAQQAVDTAKLHLDYHTADVTAALDRRKALERLVDLLQLDYFSEKEPKAHTPAGRDRLENLRRRAIRGTDDDS